MAWQYVDPYGRKLQTPEDEMVSLAQAPADTPKGPALFNAWDMLGGAGDDGEAPGMPSPPAPAGGATPPRKDPIASVTVTPKAKLVDTARKGGGTTKKTSESTTDKMVTTAPISDEDYDTVVRRLNDKAIESISDQSGGIKKMEGEFDALKGKDFKTNLSPMLALIDSLSGSKISQGYKAPETEEERTALLQKFQDRIQQARGQLSEREMNLFRSQLQNSQYKTQLAQRGEDRKDTLEYRKEQDKQRGLDRAEGRALREDDKIEAAVTELTKRLDVTSLGSMNERFRQMDGIIGKYKAGDLPGVGTGAGWLPDAAVGKDGQTIRQLGEGLKADVIHKLSGTAAGEKEVGRIKAQLGQGWTQDEAQYVKGMQILRDAMARGIDSEITTARPEVKKRYTERGGVTGETFKGIKLEQKGAGLAPGTIEDGYKFKGGDPKDPYAWELVNG